MRVNKYTLKEIIREVMSEMDESDLVVRADDGRTWEDMSGELKSDVDNLVDNISGDNYQKALDDISGIAATMKIWKHRIVMGGSIKNKGGEKHNMNRFNLS